MGTKPDFSNVTSSVKSDQPMVNPPPIPESTGPSNTTVAALVLGSILSITALVADFEGRKMYKAYQDPVGIWTICYGKTKDVYPGMVATEAQCTRWLHEELAIHAAGIKKCIKVPVNSNQFGAFTSFAYNVGVSAFCKSSLNRKLNAGDYQGACNGLHAWHYAKGRSLPGLVKRRAIEAKLCLTPHEGIIYP